MFSKNVSPLKIEWSANYVHVKNRNSWTVSNPLIATGCLSADFLFFSAFVSPPRRWQFDRIFLSCSSGKNIFHLATEQGKWRGGGEWGAHARQAWSVATDKQIHVWTGGRGSVQPSPENEFAKNLCLLLLLTQRLAITAADLLNLYTWRISDCKKNFGEGSLLKTVVVRQ